MIDKTTAEKESEILAGTKTSADLLADLIRKFDAAVDATTNSRRLAERDRDYYDNKQWTDKEREVLRKRGQPCTTNNRIKPKIDYLVGVEQKQRTDPKAFPRTPQDVDSADAATDAIRYVLDDNQFDFTRSAIFKNMLLEGIGACEVSAVPKGQVRADGTSDYRIVIKQIPWDRLFFDPHSLKDDFSDARYKGQVVWMDEAEAREKWPDAVEIFDETKASEVSNDTLDDRPQDRWVDSERKRVRIVEMWCIKGAKYVQYVFTKAGLLQDPVDSPYVNEDGFSEDPFEFQSMFVDRDGNRYGAARAWIDLQDAINKRESKSLHLMSLRQTKGEKGAVDDVNAMKRQLAKPDGHVEINPGLEFDILPTGDMAAAQFQLLQEAKQNIDAVSVNAAMAGTESRVMSGRALIAKAEGGMAEVGPIFDPLRKIQLRIYRKVWNLVRKYWTSEKWIRVTDDEKTPSYVGLNQPVTVMQKAQELERQGQPIPPELVQAAQMNPSAVVEIKNDVTELDVDIILAEVPDTVAIQAEQFEKLAGLAQSGVPIPPEALIEASGLRNKDKILEKMGVGQDGMPPQVAQQIQAAQQEMEAAAQEIAKREEEAKAQEQQMKDAAHDLEMRLLKIQAEERELALKKQIAELQMQTMAREITQPQPVAVQ